MVKWIRSDELQNTFNAIMAISYLRGKVRHATENITIKNIMKKYSYFRGLRAEREASGNIKGGTLHKNSLLN